jgi:two-component system, chemotaxis family, protein-glutamate methylesterase/glutaminase
MAFEILLLGAPEGSEASLKSFLRELPYDFSLPVVLVQHAETSMVSSCPLPVSEVEDKTLLRSGYLYPAPANYQVLVECGHLGLSLDETVAGARPAIDVLFETAAYAYADRALAVLFHSSHVDGKWGIKILRSYGACVYQQGIERVSPFVGAGQSSILQIVQRAMEASETETRTSLLIRN